MAQVGIGDRYDALQERGKELAKEGIVAFKKGDYEAAERCAEAMGSINDHCARAMNELDLGLARYCEAGGED